MADLIPATIRISYDLLAVLLKLPPDVKVLGIVGIDDNGGSFPLLIETSPKHLKLSNLKATYRQDADGSHFVGFD